MVDRLDGEVLSLLLPLLSKLTFALLVDKNEEDDMSSLFILLLLSSTVLLWCILYICFVDTDCDCLAISKRLSDIPWCWKAVEDCILLVDNTTLSADDCAYKGILVVDDTDCGNTNDNTTARKT